MRLAKTYAILSFIVAFVAINGWMLYADEDAGYLFFRRMDILGYFFLSCAFLVRTPDWWFSYITVAALLARCLKAFIADIFQFTYTDYVDFAVVAAGLVIFFLRSRWKVKQRG